METAARRVRSGLVAFAAGDALGVPWEGCEPSRIDVSATAPLRRREDWPPGSTSDDTDQLLIAAQAVAAGCGAAVAQSVLTALSERLHAIRGAGPTTTAAVERFRATGQTRSAGGTTNGAAVRALAAGWATPPGAEAHRRELTAQLTRATHDSAAALVSAQIVAAVASAAIEGAELIPAADRELERFAGQLAPYELRLLRSALTGGWSAPEHGVSMEALETVAAAVAIVGSTSDAAEGMVTAVRLGGDTDSLAALVGGLLGCRSEDQAERIPWLAQVRLPDAALLDRLAAALAERRR